MTRSFDVYDTTLRDGTQQAGINLSVADKLAVAALLDELGVGFIEGGWPGANPKDTKFFAAAASELQLRHAQLAAFGATRRAGVKVESDPQVLALLAANTPVVTLVAKSHTGHVERALRTTLAENLAMVTDTVAYLVAHGRTVFLDAEHYFDGYLLDRDYGVQVIEAAIAAGAEAVVLCDTNGGTLTHRVSEIVTETLARTGARLGIHAHNDGGCAVANSIAAVLAGATHVQGTVNGYGERTGNADLPTVVANLKIKEGMDIVTDDQLAQFTRVCHAISDLVNIAPYDRAPYVGAGAFAHKAGLHASAIKVDANMYQHIDPALVGNDMHILVSELAGRASVHLKATELGYDLETRPELLTEVIVDVKNRELRGYTYDSADASFELLLRARLEGEPLSFFDVEQWRVVVYGGRPDNPAEAVVKVHAGGQRRVAVGEGNGPVNALDMALRAALLDAFPQLAKIALVDYRVRLLNDSHGTDATTRVLIDHAGAGSHWTTIGVAPNIVEASWIALLDGVNYGLSLLAGK